MTNPEDESQKQNRLEMIRQALQDKAPLTYKDMESSGQLQKFLEAHNAKMMASYNEATNKAWEETMATFLSFADAACDESSSPFGAYRSRRPFAVTCTDRGLCGVFVHQVFEYKKLLLCR